MDSRGSGSGLHLSSGYRGRAFAPRNYPFGQSGYFLGGDPFFYADYPFGPTSAEPASPQVILLQPPAAYAAPEESTPEPLMIELRGDRYERFRGAGPSAQPTPESGAAPSDYAGTASAKSSARPLTTADATPHDLPPAVLVYRDGHREQVPDYAIVGGTIYARGDFYQNGYWTKNIELSALNIPATIQANQESGVKFVLPSAPNEVVTRP